MDEPKYSEEYLKRLREQMDEFFKIEELRVIAFDLGIDSDNLSGPQTKKSEFVVNLITYLIHRDRLNELIERLVQVRPDIEWSENEFEGMSLAILVHKVNTAGSETASRAVRRICRFVKEGKAPVAMLTAFSSHPYWLIRLRVIETIIQVGGSETLDLLHKFRTTSYHVSQQRIRDYVEERLANESFSSSDCVKAVEIIEGLLNAPKVTKISKGKNEDLLAKLRSCLDETPEV